VLILYKYKFPESPILLIFRIVYSRMPQAPARIPSIAAILPKLPTPPVLFSSTRGPPMVKRISGEGSREFDLKTLLKRIGRLRGRRDTAAVLGRRRRNSGPQLRGRRAKEAVFGRRRRDRCEEGGQKRRSSAAGVETAPSPRRGRRATAAHLGRLRRDRGEGGRPKRRSSAAGVETTAREAGHRGAYRPATAASVKTAARKAGHRGASRPPASRLRRGRQAKEAVFGRRRRDHG
jgi:hypothetical protein